MISNSDKVIKTMLATDIFRRNGNTHTSIVIDKSTKIDYTIEKIRDDFRKDIHEPEDKLCHIADQYFIYSKWNFYKTIYRFSDEDFYNMLLETEDSEFCRKAVKRLPYDCFFLVSPEPDVVGFFVYVEIAEADTLIYVVVINDVDEKDLLSYHTMMWIKDGQTIDEGLRDWYKQSEVTIPEDQIQEALGYMTTVIKTVYYLSAKNAEIHEIKTSKGNRPKKSDGKPLNLRQWNIGYRVGNKFIERKPSSKSFGTGTSPRPHMRRAHWHHFWCGPNKSVLELKWLAPMLVASKSEDDLVSTEHKVLKNN